MTDTVGTQATPGLAAFLEDEGLEAFLADEREEDTLGALDSLKEVLDRPERLVPFVSAASEGVELGGLVVAMRALENDTATPKQKGMLYSYLEHLEQPKTWGYHAVDVASQVFAFAGEWMASGGAIAAGKAGAKKVVGKALREALESAAKRKGAAALMASGRIGTQVVARTLLSEAIPQAAGKPGRVSGEAYRRMLAATGLRIEGAEGEDLSLTFDRTMPAFMDVLPESVIAQTIDVGSEMLGGAVKPLKKGAGKVAEKLAPNATARFRAAQAKVAQWWLGKGGTVAQLTKRIGDGSGWHGIVGEYMEEKAAHVGKAAVLEADTLEGLFGSIEEEAGLIAGLAVFPVAGAAARKLGDSGIIEEPGASAAPSPKGDELVGPGSSSAAPGPEQAGAAGPAAAQVTSPTGEAAPASEPARKALTSEEAREAFPPGVQVVSAEGLRGTVAMIAGRSGPRGGYVAALLDVAPGQGIKGQAWARVDGLKPPAAGVAEQPERDPSSVPETQAAGPPRRKKTLAEKEAEYIPTAEDQEFQRLLGEVQTEADRFVETANVRALRDFDTAVADAVSGIPKGLTVGANVETAIYDAVGIGAPLREEGMSEADAYGDFLTRIGMLRMSRPESVDLSSPDIQKRVAEAILRAEAESKHQDLEGLLGPMSGLTKQGKRDLLESGRDRARVLLGKVQSALEQMNAEPEVPAQIAGPPEQAPPEGAGSPGLGERGEAPAGGAPANPLEQARVRIEARKTAAADFQEKHGEVPFEADASVGNYTSVIVSRETGEPGQWRVTRFDKDGPVGHTVLKGHTAAAIEAQQEYGADLAVARVAPVEFPEHDGERLSWSIGLYMTPAERAAGYPKARAVIRAMAQNRPDQLERERRDAQKGSFDRVFGHSAKAVLSLIDEAAPAGGAQREPWEMTKAEAFDETGAALRREHVAGLAPREELERDLAEAEAQRQGLLDRWRAQFTQKTLNDYHKGRVTEGQMEPKRGAALPHLEALELADEREAVGARVQQLRDAIQRWDDAAEQPTRTPYPGAKPQKARTSQALHDSARYRATEADHRAAVEKALAEGKPVPASVLADYPDLAPAPVEPTGSTDPTTQLFAADRKRTKAARAAFVESPDVVYQDFDGWWHVRGLGDMRFQSRESAEGWVGKAAPVEQESSASGAPGALAKGKGGKASPEAELVERGPAREGEESLSDRLGKRRSATVGWLTEAPSGERLRVSVRPDPSDTGRYSIVIKNAEGSSQSFRMGVGGGEGLQRALDSWVDYLNVDQEGAPFSFVMDAPKGAKAAPKAIKRETPAPGDAADRAELKRLRGFKYKTAGHERSIERLQRQIKADPSKWKIGMGVRWQLGAQGSQVNRGFRLVALDGKTATIRQVADTGLTVTGGDSDRIGDQSVHIAQLRRDKKYDAPDLHVPAKGKRPELEARVRAAQALPEPLRSEEARQGLEPGSVQEGARVTSRDKGHVHVLAEGADRTSWDHGHDHDVQPDGSLGSEKGHSHTLPVQESAGAARKVQESVESGPPREGKARGLYGNFNPEQGKAIRLLGVKPQIISRHPAARQWQEAYVESSAKVASAEKRRDAVPMTPEQERLLEESMRPGSAPDAWRAFSEARGYTQRETAEFEKHLRLHQRGLEMGGKVDDLAWLDRQVDLLLEGAEFETVESGPPAPPVQGQEKVGDAEEGGGAGASGRMGSPAVVTDPKRKGPEGETARPRAGDGFTNDIRPLTGKEGAFKRGKKDTPKAVEASVREARARARRDGKEAHDADNIFRIVEDVARRFGVGPPGRGRARILARWAAGFYQPSSESIRLKTGSRVSTFVHEVGHHLHKVMFPRARRPKRGADGKLDLVRVSKTISAYDFPKEWRKELVTLGKDLYGDRKPTGGYATEGWAEVVRFLVTDPQRLKKRTPALYRDVVSTLVAEHPETWLVLQDAKARLANAVRLAWNDPVDQFVAHSKRSGGGLTWTNFVDFWRTGLFDRFQRAVTFKKDLGLKDIPASIDPHTAALRAMGHVSGDIKLMLESGTWSLGDTSKAPTGKGLVEILRPVRDSLREFQNYQVARRTLEKRKQGLNPLPGDPHLPKTTSSKALQDFIERSEKEHPEFKVAAAEFQTFNQWVIREYAVHWSLLTPEAAELIIAKNLEYVTFRHKKVEDAISAKRGMGRGFAGRGSGIGRFREGKGEQLFPPLEAYASTLQTIVANAQNNAAARSFTDHFEKETEGIGRWFDKLERPMDATRLAAEELSDEIRKQLGIGLTKDGQLVLPDYLESATEEQLSGLFHGILGIEGATLWKPSKRVDAENMEIAVMRDGKPVFFEVKDRRLFELLEGFGSPAATSIVMKVLSIPRQVLKGGATQYNPSFFGPNFTRDMLQAVTFTDSEISKLPTQARHRARGMRQAFFGGDLHRLFLASGADMAGIFGEYYNPADQRIDFGRMFGETKALGLVKGHNTAEAVKDMMRLGAVDRLNRAFELSARLGEFSVQYEQAKAEGKSEADAVALAGQAAADITLDFLRGGTWSRDVNQVVPFFNAAMLGLDKLGRYVKQNPTRAAGRILGLIIAPSIASMLLVGDDDDYWAKSKDQRDRYWFFPTGTDDEGNPTYFKMSKPYGLAMFAIPVERSYAAIWGINPETGKRGGDPRAFEGMAWAMVRELRPTVSVAGIQPVLEVMAGDRGYSFYRDREIVPGSDRGLPKGRQGARRSSDLARFLGRFMDYPPAKIDHLIQGWTGGLGRDVVRTGIDPLVRRIDPEAKRSEPMEFRDWLIVRRFLAGHTRSGHEAISRFYDDSEKLNRIHRGFTSLTDEDEREAYYTKHEAELELRQFYADSGREMSEWFRELRSVYDARPADMDRRVSDIYEQIIRTAREAFSTAGEVSSQ